MAKTKKYELLGKKQYEWLKSVKKALKPRDRLQECWKRGLTKKEWKRIKEIIKKHSLPCTLRRSIYGFVMQIHDHPKAWESKPPAIFQIDNGLFQESGQQLFAKEDSCMEEKIEPIAYSSKNKKLLEHYGFEALEEPEAYTY